MAKTTPADWLSDTKRVVDQLDPNKLAHAIQVAADHQDAHLITSTGGNGGGRSDGQPSDPTGQRATNEQRPDTTHAELRGCMDRIGQDLANLNRFVKQLSARAQDRPAITGPCQNRFTHVPNDAGTRCALGQCGKPWPCRDGETESHVTECDGRINPETNKCGRCELTAGHWVCIDCPTGQDVHGPDTKQVKRRCPKHDQANRRNQSQQLEGAA